MQDHTGGKLSSYYSQILNKCLPLKKHRPSCATNLCWHDRNKRMNTTFSTMGFESWTLCKCSFIRLQFTTNLLSFNIQIWLSLLGCIECWQFLPMFAMSVCLSVSLSGTQLKLTYAVYAVCRVHGVIRCSLRQMPLASCHSYSYWK